MKTYTVAVRALCEFAAREGDLDLRFTPAPSAREGIAGHQSVSANRPAGHRSEVPLSGSFRNLVVRGRADGYDPGRQRLEEVKTFRGDLSRMPANHRVLHWAQAKVYAALLCREFDLPALDVALVYFDIGRQTEAPALVQHCTGDELQAFFEALCERFIDWADLELEHRDRRDTALTPLAFPHPDFRAGQHDLAKSVYNAARGGRCLLAQAPTGIGKTMATLFPMLKACPGQAIDKVFFLTAKGSGRALALDAIDTLRRSAPGLPLRVIELVARDKACEHPDKVCHGDSCPLARGFYDRLPEARRAAVAHAGLTREALREVALAHGVCPYHLGQEVVRWCDVVVGDYNHYFDSAALLHGLTLAGGWRVAVLVDEAHNLVDRAREMYSASLDSAKLRALSAGAPAGLVKPLARLERSWRRLVKDRSPGYHAIEPLPASFIGALEALASAIGEHLADHPTGVDSEWLAFYFDLLRFGRLVQTFASHSIFDLTLAEGASVVCLRNVVPASFLAPRFAATRAAVLFSATLAPQRFYADTLGLPDDAAWLDVKAPFEAAQLRVRVVRSVSTRWRDRGGSLAPIAALIERQYTERPGNYLAFFSSHEYLAQAAAEFTRRCPRIPSWQQTGRMDEAARAAFLARFEVDGRGVGFAVLGGSFAEGIDLAGTRLIGAFIATLGLPQFNPVNEAMRERMQIDFGAGYDYTYLYPGLRKVVQAAGRVIRSAADTGSVHLIDDRFDRPEVLRLLPAWWRVERGDAAGPPVQCGLRFVPG